MRGFPNMSRTSSGVAALCVVLLACLWVATPADAAYSRRLHQSNGNATAIATSAAEAVAMGNATAAAEALSSAAAQGPQALAAALSLANATGNVGALSQAISQAQARGVNATAISEAQAIARALPLPVGSAPSPAP